MRSSTVVVLVLLVLGNVGPAASREWHVPNQVSTIAAAIDSAAMGESVVIAGGTYMEHDLVVKSGITIRSETGLPDCVTIDAQQLGSNLLCNALDGTTVISGIRLLAGETGNSGGIIQCTGGSSPYFERCIFEGGVADLSGGGVYCLNSTPNFVDCQVLGNRVNAGNGGALAAFGSSPVLTGCLFRGNWSQGDGGGMNIEGGALSLNNCTFEENEASNYGGGLRSIDCGGEIADCRFQGNLAGSGGGGALINWGDVVLLNSSFEGNQAVGLWGGGLQTGGGVDHTVQADNCIFTGNSAPEGGGIKGGCNLILRYCGFSENVASNYGGGISFDGGIHLEVEYSTILGNIAPDVADGLIHWNSTATLRCCEIETSAWHDLAVITIDNEDCQVAVESSSWGSLKSLFR